jgi:hypothetical protein
MRALALILCLLALWMITPDPDGEDDVRSFAGEDGVQMYRAAQAWHALIVAAVAFWIG